MTNQHRSPQTKYETSAIKNLLLEAFFSDERFTIFCYDYFHPAYEKFNQETLRTKKVQLVIAHCSKHNLFDQLLSLIKHENPTKYEEHGPYIRGKLQNPFHFGGPVSPEQFEKFVGHQEAVETCLNRLKTSQPANITVYGERRIGKTSLLHYLERFGSQVQKENHLCLFLDLGLFGGTLNSTAFWYAVLDLLQNTPFLPRPVSAQITYLQNQPALTITDVQQLLKDYHQFFSETSIILLVDEFELFFKPYNQDIQNLLIGLRALTLAPVNKFALITATRTPLSQVCQPFMQETEIDFAGHFVACQLESFDYEETRRVVETLLAETHIEFTLQELNYIWQLSQWQGGNAHPMFVQVAASLIFEHKLSYKDPIDYRDLERKFEIQTKLYRTEIPRPTSKLVSQIDQQPNVDYEKGLKALEERLPLNNSALVVKFYTLARQLRKHIRLSPTAQGDRKAIIDELTRLSREVTGLSFDQLASGQQPE